MFKKILGLVTILSFTACENMSVNTPDNIICMSHRGHVSETTFENTLDAFYASFDLGADGTELDVFHTKDNIAMVFHDKTLGNKTVSTTYGHCDPNKGVGDYTYDELQENCRLSNGDSMPTLEEVFMNFAHTDFKILVEFKDVPKQETIDLIETYYEGQYHKVIATIFPKDYFKAVWDGTVNTPFTFLMGGSHYVKLMEPDLDGADIANVSAEDIKRLKYDGNFIGLYGVDTEDQMNLAFDLGVDMITTDNTPLCVDVKRERVSNL